MKKENPPVDGDEITHHELTRAVNLGDQQLSIEAVTHWYAEKLDHELPGDQYNLLDFICRMGIAGVRKLRERLEGQSKLQTQYNIQKSNNKT